MSIGQHMPDVLARVMVTDKCWIWLGSRSTKGYGQIMRDNKHLQVHRIAFESEYGDLPAGMVVDHLCHDPKVCAGGTCVHRLCVNPAHLQATTNEANLRRQTPAAKTNCDSGHPLDGVSKTNGRRYCIACKRAQSVAWHQKRFTVWPSTVRCWAIEQGLTKSTRGALSKQVIAAWDAAHPERPFRVIESPETSERAA